jgi:hypothetical protein
MSGCAYSTNERRQGRIVNDKRLGHRGTVMLQQSEKSDQRDLVGKAFQEWRDAANEWSDFSSLLQQDVGRMSFEQRKRLRELQKQLNKASDEYMRARLLTKLGHSGLS